MRRTLLVAPLAGALGLGAGRLLFGRAPRGPTPVAAALLNAARAPGAAAAPGDPERPSAEALARRVRQLETQLAQERVSRQMAEGDAQSRPAGLPERFAQQALQQAFSRALRELALPAQVTSIDCGEFPCIVYGEGFGTFAEGQRLLATRSLAAYAGDERRVFGWAGPRGPDGRGRQFFGIAVFPTGVGQAASLAKRLDARVLQMKEASR